ncbi:MAG TPA: thiamine-phosphate kinase [Terracidiphilus sp.]
MPLSEKLFIERLRRVATRGIRLVQGIGDDCAVLELPRGQEVLITTDFTLEEVHFRREWHPADSVGHRCLARGLSDIAAMGGLPHAAFLSLALPAELPQDWVDRFMAGLLKLAARFSLPLAGGDTAQSPDRVVADIVVLGSVPKGKAVLRSGARAGDLLYVTGSLGSSAASLNQLREGKKLRPKSNPRHFYPEPRLAVGQFLRKKNLASAMIDISDGLSTDLGHLCEESGAGVVLSAEALPAVHGTDGLRFALHGGDDYELLFTAHPNRRIPKQIAGVPVTRIGEMVQVRQMKLARPNGKMETLKPAGWEHFS